MKDALMKKLEKKGKKLDPLEKEAKMGIVKEMGRQAGALLSGKIPGKKQVTVAADSKEGLKAGLEKAEDIVEGEEGVEPELEGMKEAMGEKPPMEGLLKEMENCTPEEIDEKIAELEMLKAKMQGEK